MSGSDRRGRSTFGLVAWRAFGAFLVVAAIGAQAQPYPTPPTAAAPRPLAIAAPLELRLDNGMTVVVARREGVPLVTAELVARSGAERDPAGRGGVASLTAALLSQGTRRHSAPQIAAAAEALGGSIATSAGFNQSVVGMTVATPHVDAALGLIAEVVREPAFAAAEIERVRAQTLDELKVTYADPGAVAAIVAQRLTYGDGAYGRPLRGTPKSLPKIARDDIVAAHRVAFRPEQSALILAGDIDASRARALAERHFGSWRGAGPAPGPAQVASAAADGARFALVDLPSAGQAGIAFGLALPERDSRELATSAVANAVLGGGYSSRLNQEVRIRRGLSYGIGSAIEPRLKRGFLVIDVQTKNESAAEVVALVRAEVERLGAAPASDDELGARQAALIGGFSRAVETTSGLAAAVRSLLVAGRPPAELTTRIDAFSAVRADDVQRYAQARLASTGLRIAVVGAGAAFADALRRELPGLVVVPAAALDLERDDLR